MLLPEEFIVRNHAMAVAGILGLILGAGGEGQAADARPNILFCIADDASATLGCYGTKWVNSPNIDRLAAGGVLFTQAFVPTAKCAPCRAAILTGRYPWLLEDAANHQNYFPARFKAVTEALAQAGYACGSTGKVWGPGEAKTADGQNRTWGMTHQPIARKASEMGWPGSAFQKFLADKPAGKPFFFWFGSSNPHRPYKAGAGQDSGKKPADIDRVPAFWPDNDIVRNDMLDYATEVEDFDREVGSLLKVLAASGQADNTLVIVTSDHGMPFPRSKGHNYHISNHVPFIVAWPKGIVEPGRKTDAFLNLVDLAPTFCELAGIDPKSAGLEPPSGQSFVDLLKTREGTRSRPYCITGRERNDVYARPGSPTGLGYPVRALREGPYLYIHNFAPDRWPCGNPELGFLDSDNGPTKKFAEAAGEQSPWWQFAFGKRPADELYDVTQDPDCVKNLASADPARVTAMKNKLFTILKEQGDPRMFGKGDAFDHYPTVKPKPEGWK